MDVGARVVLSFVTVFAYHALSAVGDILEDPYTPYDPNELPLPEIQDTINTRLLMFGMVPAPSHRLKTSKQENGVPQPAAVPIPPPEEPAQPAKQDVRTIGTVAI